MLKRFKRELYEFLLQENISLESNIVNRIVYDMAKIDMADHNFDYYGFDLSNDRYGRNEKENEPIQFSLPTLDWDQFNQLLALFKIPLSATKTNSKLTLDGKYALEEFLPAFKEHFQLIKHNNPELISPYRVKSKAILESSAISTLNEYAQKAISTILSNPASLPLEDEDAIYNAMVLIKGNLAQVSNEPVVYKKIINAKALISQFLLNPDVTNNKKLALELKLVAEGIDLFTKYHRNESVIALKTFKVKMEEFLRERGITTAVCNAFENTLLRLADAKLGVKGNCEYKIGSDKSRLVIEFTDMDKENAKKVVNFLQRMGDDTATEGYGYKHYGSSIPESMSEEKCMKMSLSSLEARVEPRVIIESHSIEVDGKFLYETLFPLLQKEIDAMKDTAPEVLEAYRKDSTVYFEKLKQKAIAENPILSDKKDALFQPATITINNGTLEKTHESNFNSVL